MKMLFDYLSKKTLPSYAVTDELGHMWIPVSLKNEYPYSYQGLKQDKWGRWSKDTVWMNRWHDMNYYKEESQFFESAGIEVR